MIQDHLPVIEHAGYLEPLEELPAYLMAEGGDRTHSGQFSCHFCGVGTSAKIPLGTRLHSGNEAQGGFFRIYENGESYPALLQGGYLQLMTSQPVVPAGALLEGELELTGSEVAPEAAPVRSLKVRAFDLLLEPDGRQLAQRFLVHPASLESDEPLVENPQPTVGCIKLRHALGERPSVYPLHLRPSVMDITGRRVPLFYEEALERFAHLVLEHRPPRARTLIYASGQIDYFAVFAMQEVFRLLGVRNMTSNCEHGYLSGGLYQTFVAGQPAPFVTIKQALQQPQGLYLLNGWNGYVSHPPVFKALLKKQPFDGWLIDVMQTESAQLMTSQLGPSRVLLIRPGGDSQLALGIAHELLTNWHEALEPRFLTEFSDPDSFERFAELAREARFAPNQVAERIAPEPAYRERIEQGIREIAASLARPGVVPVQIPSMGFSQTRGIVPHCLWANILAMLGKFGLNADGSLAGGVLQLPGQINHETHLQGLSQQHFMGRIPIDQNGAAEAARRLGLPDDVYDKMMMVTPLSALDYSEPESRRELFVFFGSQFATSMMNRPRWLRKLTEQQTQFIVIDPAPDEFCLKHAALIMPTPPHVATSKLYQNGEWRLSLSLPRRKAPSQARSDATIIYDLMACIGRQLRSDRGLWLQHPDLAQLISRGYFSQRFESPALQREDGEISRAQLWARIQHYFSGEGANGQELYCRPRHSDGRPISWQDLLTEGSLIHSGVGSTRQRLDYDGIQSTAPFTDLYGQPVDYRFFRPSESDLALGRGLILCTGRSALSEQSARTAYAVSTFNTGKLSSPYELPAENPLYISHMLAERYNLSEGDRVWATNRETRTSLVLTVVPTSRLKGEIAYLSIHKSRAETEHGRYANLLTSHRICCPYTGQTGLKLTRIELQKVEDKLPR